jgi:hypothetical protein
VLQQHELNPPVDPRALLLALAVLRELAGYGSQDALLLSIYAAASDLGMNKEEAVKMLLPLLKRAGTHWPEGFM